MACVSVIVLHISDTLIYSFKQISSNLWWFANILDGLGRFAVPVFFMITGALMTKENIKLANSNNYRLDYKKYFFKFFNFTLIYICWSIFYIILNSILNNRVITANDFIGIINFSSFYHLWFFEPLLFIYLIMPLIQKLLIRIKRKEIFFLLIIWCLIGILLPFLNEIINLKFFYLLEYNSIVSKLYLIYKALGFVFIGFYIEKYRPQKALKYGFVIATIGVLATIILTYLWINKENGTVHSYVYNFASINISIEAIGVFLFISNIIKDKSKLNYNIKLLGNCCFGIFIVHPFILSLIYYYTNISLSHYPSFINYLLTIFIGIIGSYILTYILSRIPLIKKMVLF